MDVQTTLQTMLEAFTDPMLKVQALITIIQEYGYDPDLRSVVNNSLEYANVRQNALIVIGTIVPDITFTSSTDAENLKNQLSYIFDAENYCITDRQLFLYFNELQAAIQTVISENGYGLPEIVTYETKVFLPAALISQKMYQSGLYDDDIVLRNNANVKHPLFMPLTLEVLSGISDVN